MGGDQFRSVQSSGPLRLPAVRDVHFLFRVTKKVSSYLDIRLHLLPSPVISFWQRGLWLTQAPLRAVHYGVFIGCHMWLADHKAIIILSEREKKTKRSQIY